MGQFMFGLKNRIGAMNEEQNIYWLREDDDEKL